jgi:hypothetical protein
MEDRKLINMSPQLFIKHNATTAINFSLLICIDEHFILEG